MKLEVIGDGGVMRGAGSGGGNSEIGVDVDHDVF